LLISETNLSVRSRNALNKAGYIRTDELKNLTRDDLANLSNIGTKSIDEIAEFLKLPYETNKVTLSIRSQNALAKAGYYTIEEIKNLTEKELRNIQNLGEKSIQEILSLKTQNNFINDAYELNSLSYHKIKNGSIETLKLDNELNVILKNNNIQTIEVLLELKKSDLKKFRGVNAPQVLVLKDIINGLRDELKLNYQGIADIPFSNPQLQVKEAIINSLPYKDVEFYFRNGFKLKKTIDITCNEAKESDIKKIKELEINKIENLIKIIPSNIKNLKGMNEKSTSRVLKLLLNKLVITYNNDIVLEGISYNFFRNHHYNFWLNIEDNILYSLTCKVDDVIKKYVNVNYHSFKELSYFISHNTEIIKEIEGLELSKQEANELVYSYLKNYSTKMNYKYLKEKFEKVNNKINFVEIVNNLIDEGLVTLEDGKIVTLKKPVLYYAKRLKSENQFEALKYRLKNYTLQEIEDKLGLTRERARQLIKQGLNNLPSNVRENTNAYWFENYKLNQSLYNYLFEDNAYNYLALIYSEGEESWSAIINDEMADESLKRKVFDKSQKDMIVLDEVTIPNNKTSIIRYLIQNFCKEVTSYQEIEELYSLFLEEHVNNKKNLELNARYIETRISDQEIVVERPKKRFRFYDYNEYDWNIFYKELGLLEWKDMDLSTEIIFKANEKLMDDYNILNKYELHNIMKRTNSYFKDINIKFGRTPHLIIGDGNRETQVKNLLFENSPIKKEDLAELYFQLYGVNKESIIANYFNIIKEYQINDIYVAKDIEINEEILNELISVVDNKSIVFLEDIQKSINIETSTITLYLNQLGFKKYDNYYISDGYSSTTELFEQEIFNEFEIIDADSIDSRIWSLSSFRSQVYKKIYSMDIIEFDNNKFITINKLKKIGLSKEIFLEFRKETILLLQDNQFWSLTNILEVADKQKIDEFGFNDIFYRSLLRGASNVYNHRISNNYLFKLKEPVSLKSFLFYLINNKKIVDIYNLMSEIKSVYDLDIEKHKIVEIIKKLGMYYDEIMEKIYFDIDYYYEEFL